jgi:hypothetical protein
MIIVQIHWMLLEMKCHQLEEENEILDEKPLTDWRVGCL